jgi:ADP-heptose:LPS heptosyltransferase
LLVIHPGSGSSRKNWSTEKYAELVHLATNHGLRVLLLEGQADHEAVRRLLERLKVELPVLRNLDLMAVAALISEARMYVGNDSGITHLAAAVGASTWALFGPTNPKLWAPRGRRAFVSSFETEPDELWITIQKVSANVGDCP